VSEKLKECDKELESSKAAAGAVGTRFEEVKRERQELFQECYEHVSESLGVIYRSVYD
jgi:chromosome segregation ATPase